MSVISNTTVLLNFAAIHQIEVLHHLFGEIYISAQVYEEIVAGIEEGYRFYTAIEPILSPLSPHGWLRLTSLNGDDEFRTFAEMPSGLHSGESSCLAIAQGRHWLFLSDDKAARKEAYQRGIALSGTLGCLILGIERGICSLDSANSWLRNMVDNGYRSPVSDLASLFLNQ